MDSVDGVSSVVLPLRGRVKLDGSCTRCSLIGIHIWKSKIWHLVFNFTFVMMYKFLLDDSVGLLVLLKRI